jgi:hypothetical protein
MAEVQFLGDFQMASSGTPTVLVDYTSSIKSIKFNRNGETHDVTTLGNYAKKWIKGLTEGDIQIEMFRSPANYTAMQNLLDYIAGGVSWQLGVEGSASGAVKASQVGTLNSSTGIGLVIEKVETSVDVGGVKMLTISGKISGAITHGTYA